jgi:hypothetical protein
MIRDGGAVALACVVYLELRHLRTAVEKLAERMATR